MTTNSTPKSSPSEATVVGLTGFAGAGKSTAADYLVENYGFTRLSFAGPLKEMLRTLNPYIVASPVTSVNEEPLRVNDLFTVMTETQIKEGSAGAEYRRLLQVLGTDCIRAIDPDFWVKAAVAQIAKGGKYVFDDVRFPNEAGVIQGYNPFSLWNIERDSVQAANGHSSEQHAGKMNEGIFLINVEEDKEILFDQIDMALQFMESLK